MSNIPYSVEQIIDFCKNNEILIVERKDRKNQKFRESCGKTEEEAEEEIRKLEKKYCKKDKILDKDKPDNYLYEFHKEVWGKWCYIKLSIIDERVIVNVISFHESEGTEYE